MQPDQFARQQSAWIELEKTADVEQVLGLI